MLTIVIADAEPFALQHALAGVRNRGDDWELHFADGVTAALALFDQITQVDVVVANMDSLGGVNLLCAVRRRSPKTARIMLSGLPARHSPGPSAGVAHHCLTSPLDVDELDHAIGLVRASPRIELQDPVRSLIDQTDRLPSPPALFQRIVEMLKSDRWTSDGVAELLSSDVAVTAEILKLANSALFGYAGNVKSVGRAVSLLGLDLIRTLVLGNKLFLPHEDLEGWLDLEQLDRRCKSVASGAHALALRDGASPDVSGTAYLAGMVNEVGLLVMARVPNIGAAMASPLNTRTFPDVERALFGGDRFVVGCHLLELWGFDADVVDGILQLNSPTVLDSIGIPWYLHASRTLVLDEGFDPLALAVPAGFDPEVDAALTTVRDPHAITRVAQPAG